MHNAKPKIGIGVTTFLRKNLLQECLDNIRSNTTSDFNLYVAEDKLCDRKGVAKRKNECLYYLQDCDYIFLFDDDCYPKQKGWEKFIIDAHLVSGEHHFNYLVDKIHKIQNHYFYGDYTIQSHKDCGGVFMFLTKECLKKVGGFFTDYGLYGFEHIGYSCRCTESKLTSSAFLSIEGLGKYLFAYDYEGGVQSTISNKEKFVEKNKSVFKLDMQSIYKPISYE